MQRGGVLATNRILQDNGPYCRIISLSPQKTMLGCHITLKINFNMDKIEYLFPLFPDEDGSRMP
jgi:hypothetical protein